MDKKTLDLKGEEEISTDAGQSEETLESEPEVEPEGEDDNVVLSKEEHTKLLQERENYKKGLLSYKEKAKQPKGEDVLTKTDFHKINEKEAIDAFVKDNPELEWNKLVSYYGGNRGRDTVEAIIKDLDDAKTLLLKHNPAKEDDKGAKADLSTDKSLTGSFSDETKPQEKGGILKRSAPVQEWYKKSE